MIISLLIDLAAVLPDGDSAARTKFERN